jgi:hexosaminidase
MINIVPKPQSIEIVPGKFEFKRETTLLVSNQTPNRQFLADFVSSLIPGTRLIEKGDADITLRLLSVVDNRSESYSLDVKKNGIIITAGDEPGLFYGIQTLRQLLPNTAEKGTTPLEGYAIQSMIIEDYPRFSWRGMHLDVSRHFFPVDFVKSYIDMIAFHKMNVFHWHLTDDNGWRLEIKRYPKLTEISAYRVDREHEDWRKWSPIQEGEKSTYGGFYTQEEVKDIIAYAAERQITVIPEIEMPGHSSEIFAAYPELSCKGELLAVRPGSYWPVEDILCAGNDSVFTFLENVIDEVVELFPASYIHIGGDEASKTYWKTCSKCQNRIKVHNLADEHELQSWFIKKMEKYIIAKGKRIIGWDEILEGGLAAEATVMSWRGEAGGIAAAKAGHDVIMTPTSHVYFDYYQGDPTTEPQAIGGYLTLKKVYSYEPIPAELNKDEQKYILGSQGNLWTEFVKTQDHAEYMVLPRMTAMAEVVWTEAEKREWNDFYSRLHKLFPRFEQLGWNYSQGTFLLEILPGRLLDNQSIEVEILSEQPGYDIRFTRDGSEPLSTSEKYVGKLGIKQDSQIRAALFDKSKILGRFVQRDFAFHQAVGADAKYELMYHPKYQGSGDKDLLDGVLGSENFRDGTWQGFEGHDLQLTIDLGELQNIFKVEMNFLQSTPSWIFMPDYLEVSISIDGENWTYINRANNEVSEKDNRVIIRRLTSDFATREARFIKVLAKNKGVCPDWHEGAGGKAWIFCDEVIVK